MSTVFEVLNAVVWGILFLVLIVKFFRSIRLVPTQSAYIVERLGKYSRTLKPGFHALVPFLDRVAFIRDLKELTVDVPPQECFTRDEVQVEVDGVIYMSVTDPVKASYGVTSYSFAATQLAQTTTRSVIGTLGARPHLRREGSDFGQGSGSAREVGRDVGDQGSPLRDQESVASADGEGSHGEAGNR